MIQAYIPLFLWFSGRIFLTLHFIKWPNFIIWLPLFVEILGNMCIAIICDCDVKNFEINLFIKAFLYYITIFKEFAVNKRNIFGSWVSDFKIILNIVLVLSAKKGLTVFEKILFSVKDISIKIFFSIWVMFHEHSWIIGLQGKGEGIPLTPHYHFHLLHIHLNISWAITLDSSPLHIAARLEPGTFGFQAKVTNHWATCPSIKIIINVLIFLS